MARDLARSASARAESVAAIRSTVAIAGRRFAKIDLPDTPLSRVVFATDIRCHVVIFSFAGGHPDRLRQLAASLNRLSLDHAPSVPDCVKGYATPQTIERKIGPVPAGPQFVKVPVRIVIGVDGKVEHIHVVRADPAQRRNIEDALLQWRFRPYQAAGHVGEIETGLTFEFRPSGRPD
jgi:hypothetical protein